MKAVAFFCLGLAGCSGTAATAIELPPATDAASSSGEDAGQTGRADSGGSVTPDVDAGEPARDASGFTPLAACLTSGTCAGCCDLTGCVPAGASTSLPTSCGLGGILCAVCTAGQTCALGNCE